MASLFAVAYRFAGTWFGPAAQQGLPAHGFARNLPWTLKSHREDADGVALTFELTQSEETKKFWYARLYAVSAFPRG